MKSNTHYDEALQFIKRNPGTGGAGSLAKLVLSLYNQICGYSFAECVGNLDEHLTEVAVRMVKDYAEHGETEDLRAAGKIIVDLYPGLWEMSLAMNEARAATRAKWEADERRAEREALETAEAKLFSDPAKFIPAEKAKELLDKHGRLYAYYCDSGGEWRDSELALDKVHASIDLTGGAELSRNCPDGEFLAVRIDGRVYYVHTDYDAHEAYLETVQEKREPIPAAITIPLRGTQQ